MKEAHCTICNSDKSTPLFATRDFTGEIPGTFNILSCKTCRFVYTNPQIEKEDFKNYYTDNHYVRAVRGFVDPVEQRRLNNVYKTRYNFIKHFKEDGTLLDVGTGDGLFLSFIKDKGWAVVGIEPSQIASNFAREKSQVTVYTGDLLDTQLEEKQFDVVTMWEVLEHLPDIREHLKRVHTLLREDGIYVASVPNFSSLQRLIFGRYWLGLSVPSHLYHFTPSTLRKILDMNGFIDIKVYPSLINIVKNPIREYSDSLRYFLRNVRSHPGEPFILKKKVEEGKIGDGQQEGPSVRNAFIDMVHLLEFIVFSTVEIFSYCLGRTGTLFVVARKGGALKNW